MLERMKLEVFVSLALKTIQEQIKKAEQFEDSTNPELRERARTRILQDIDLESVLTIWEAEELKRTKYVNDNVR